MDANADTGGQPVFRLVEGEWICCDSAAKEGRKWITCGTCNHRVLISEKWTQEWGRETRSSTPVWVWPEPSQQTREEWLNQASKWARVFIETTAFRHGIEIEWPEGDFDLAVAEIEGKGLKNAIGVCRQSYASEGRARIRICPSMDDEVYIVHVLIHEMVHACTEGDGHRGRFPRLMKALGSAGNPTATIAGPEQSETIMAEVLPYLRPYGEIHIPYKVLKRGERGKGSRLKKIECECCGIIMRASRMVCDVVNGGPCPAMVDLSPCDGHLVVSE